MTSKKNKTEIANRITDNASITTSHTGSIRSPRTIIIAGIITLILLLTTSPIIIRLIQKEQWQKADNTRHEQQQTDLVLFKREIGQSAARILNDGTPLQATPENGYATYYVKKAPAITLTVVAPLGQNNYFVKIQNPEGQPALTIFVRSGETATAALPPGAYRLKYATGTDWYGPEKLFGPTGTIFLTDMALTIEAEQNPGNPYTVTLIQQYMGNSVAISPKEF